MHQQWQSHRRALRAIAVAAAGAVSLALVAPAEAHYQPSISHLWGHIKALADARYAKKADFQTLRGTYVLIKASAAGGGELIADGLSFNPKLSAEPTPHIIPYGDTPPAECPGTPASPQAAPGHLCVYVAYNNNASTPNVQDPADNPGTVGTYGTMIYAYSSAAGYVESRGTWAVTRP